jgi:hypothetical protein
MDKRREFVLLLSLFCLLSLASVVFAQTGSGYDTSWHVIASGGGTSESLSHIVVGTIGQPVSGVSTWDYTVNSGFWYTHYYRVYLPIVLRE